MLGLGPTRGKDWAAVVFEYDSCTIKLAIVDPQDMLPGSAMDSRQRDFTGLVIDKH